MNNALIIGLLIATAGALAVLAHVNSVRRRRQAIRDAILKELRRKSLEAFSLEDLAREAAAPMPEARTVAREIYRDFYQKCASDGVLTEAEKKDLALLADRFGMNEIEVRHIEQKISEGLYRPLIRTQAARVALPDAELRTLQALRTSLRLPGRGAAQALERRAIEVYRKRFSDFASDGVLEDAEIEKLHSLADQIGLDQAKAIEVIKGEALRLIERVFAFAKQDRVITEREEAEILRLQKLLNIQDSEIPYIKDEIRLLRRSAEVRRGTLPSAESPVPLASGECCHWTGDCTYRHFQEKKQGRLVVTGKKVLFLAEGKVDFEVPYGKIKNIMELPDGFGLRCEGETGSGYYFIADGNIVLEMLLHLAEKHGAKVEAFEAEAVRQLPHHVKLTVWERDMARCTRCSSTEDIEFEYVTPLSEGAESVSDNVRLVCRKCRISARKR